MRACVCVRVRLPLRQCVCVCFSALAPCHVFILSLRVCVCVHVYVSVSGVVFVWSLASHGRLLRPSRRHPCPGAQRGDERERRGVAGGRGGGSSSSPQAPFPTAGSRFHCFGVRACVRVGCGSPPSLNGGDLEGGTGAGGRCVVQRSTPRKLRAGKRTDTRAYTHTHKHKHTSSSFQHSYAVVVEVVVPSHRGAAQVKPSPENTVAVGCGPLIQPSSRFFRLRRMDASTSSCRGPAITRNAPRTHILAALLLYFPSPPLLPFSCVHCLTPSSCSRPPPTSPPSLPHSSARFHAPCQSGARFRTFQNPQPEPHTHTALA